MFLRSIVHQFQKRLLLQAVADCPASLRNLPEEVVKHGFVLGHETENDGRELYFIFKRETHGSPKTQMGRSRMTASSRLRFWTMQIALRLTRAINLGSRCDIHDPLSLARRSP